MKTKSNVENVKNHIPSTQKSIVIPVKHLNNLNCPPLKPSAPPPDLLHNVPHYECKGDQVKTRHSTTGEPIQVDIKQNAGPKFYNSCECNRCRRRKKPRSKSTDKLVRGLCCLGWIFCCPIFTLGWAMRTAPLDKTDLQEDDCYPCYTSSHYK